MNEEMTFEQAMERIEEIISRFDRDDVGLDESISLYEEGVKLADICRKKLEIAEQRVTLLDETKERTE